MELRTHLEKIIHDIQNACYQNEAEVSQGIVLRLLHALNWQIFDSEIVCPEYSVEGGRVDYALCHPRSKPIVFIEVKQLGNAEGAERQLFEYAFHNGVPMAILTDGQEWNFFLPGEQGQYQDRRIYKLDLLEREIDESVELFERYLLYQSVASGKAIDAARKDYQNVARNRQIVDTLPIAWNKLIEEQDDLLIDLIAEKVESLCGYKPDSESVSKFLRDLDRAGFDTRPVKPAPRPIIERQRHKKPIKQIINEKYGFVFMGQAYQARNARDVMTRVLKELDKSDPNFISRFAEREHGKKRRYIARNKLDLYPGRPDLCNQQSIQLKPGWYLGTNYSKDDIIRILMLACDVAGIKYGKDLIVNM